MSSNTTTSTQEHRRKLEQLGLYDSASDASDIEMLQATSVALQEEYNTLADDYANLAEQLIDCDETTRFLRSAVEAAEKEEFDECVAQTGAVQRKQERALQTVQSCQAELNKTLGELPLPLQTRAAHFLGKTLTATERKELRTDIRL